MYYIIVDTNIVYNDFYLESKDWQKLCWLNKWKRCEICIPEFVVDEIIKKYKECIAKTINWLKKVKGDVKRYHLSNINLDNLDKKEYVEKYVRDFGALLEDEGIRKIPYPNSKEYIKQISKRYFLNMKPFDIDKPSFQDAIIWYSILDFVRSGEKDDKFYFITNNNRDFADPKDKNQFHQQLLEELSEEEKNQLSLYHNIEIFLKDHEDLIEECKEECKEEYKEEVEEEIQNIQEIIEEYIKSICMFEERIDLKEIIIDNNIVQDFIESDLLNSNFENEYGDIGWGEADYIEEAVLIEEGTEIEFLEDLKGYATFEVNVEVDYSVVTKNPLYEDVDDEEFLYERNHHKDYVLQIQFSFNVDKEILNEEDPKEIIEEYVQFYKAEIWET